MKKSHDPMLEIRLQFKGDGREDTRAEATIDLIGRDFDHS